MSKPYATSVVPHVSVQLEREYNHMGNDWPQNGVPYIEGIVDKRAGGPQRHYFGEYVERVPLSGYAPSGV